METRREGQRFHRGVGTAGRGHGPSRVFRLAEENELRRSRLAACRIPRRRRAGADRDHEKGLRDAEDLAGELIHSRRRGGAEGKRRKGIYNWRLNSILKS